jgi:hypothetical protein
VLAGFAHELVASLTAIDEGRAVALNTAEIAANLGSRVDLDDLVDQVSDDGLNFGVHLFLGQLSEVLLNDCFNFVHDFRVGLVYLFCRGFSGG